MHRIYETQLILFQLFSQAFRLILNRIHFVSPAVDSCMFDSNIFLINLFKIY